jgi:hypothetical protein
MRMTRSLKNFNVQVKAEVKDEEFSISTSASTFTRRFPWP